MPGDPELLMRRFEREARATAALKSPHTVQLYDFGVTDDGTLYYVMELLDGLDLDTLVERYGPLPAERAIHILRQVCASLADAHANGLVHRDIKPANIVVSRIGHARSTSSRCSTSGWSSSTARSVRATRRVKLTADGSTSGTPAFMAPEVVLGAAETDHRVDIYSLGCVAYWLLTGKLVFEGRSAIKVMFDHAHTPAAAVTRVGATDPGAARGAHHGVPGEGPGAAAGQRERSKHSAPRPGIGEPVDLGAGRALVGSTPAGERATGS